MISDQSLVRTNSNSAVQNFESVQQSHLNRMVDILGETYEAVWWVLGSDLFRSLCQDYIESQMSGPYSLNEFGSNMGEFIESQPSAYDIPFLADLARFEWIYKGIQITDSPRPLSPAMLRELITAKDYRVQFVNALEIYSSEFAISEIWRHRKGPSYKFEEINWGIPENLLIYKRDGEMQVHKISALDAQILNELADGQSITATFGRSAEALDAFKVQELLEMMTQSGIIEDILVFDS